MHWQFHGGRQKTLYTRKVADVTKLTDFTDLQTYGFVRLSQPGAHPRTHAVYNTKRCGEAGALRQVVPTRARTREGRGGGACEICCGGAGLLRSEPVAFSSSGVPPVGWGGAGLRSCWEAGPRARAHA